MGRSVSTVTAKIGEREFNLNASMGALLTLESYRGGDSYLLIFTRLGSGFPSLSDVSAAFAAFALPHGRYAPSEIAELMTPKKGLKEAANAIAEAYRAAWPAETDAEEAKEGTADPR